MLWNYLSVWFFPFLNCFVGKDDVPSSVLYPSMCLVHSRCSIITCFTGATEKKYNSEFYLLLASDLQGKADGARNSQIWILFQPTEFLGPLGPHVHNTSPRVSTFPFLSPCSTWRAGLGLALCKLGGSFSIKLGEKLALAAGIMPPFP